jgi:hypothetical protein
VVQVEKQTSAIFDTKHNKTFTLYTGTSRNKAFGNDDINERLTGKAKIVRSYSRIASNLGSTCLVSTMGLILGGADASFCAARSVTIPAATRFLNNWDTSGMEGLAKGEEWEWMQSCYL